MTSRQLVPAGVFCLWIRVIFVRIGGRSRGAVEQWRVYNLWIGMEDRRMILSIRGILLMGLLLPAGWLAAQAPRQPRYLVVFDDGSRVQDPRLTGWDSPAGQPKVGESLLFSPGKSMRWMRDRRLLPGAAPSAYVESVGGDRFPGLVTDYVDLAYDGRDATEAHFRVVPKCELRSPDGPASPYIRVTRRSVRRIVWQSLGLPWQPGSLWYRDGRRLRFRAVRWSAGGLSVLTDDGPRRLGFQELAELHLPLTEFWPHYFDEVARLSPHAESRWLQMETTDGLLVTTSLSRLLPFARAAGSDSRRWVHVVQPAWSLDALWVPNARVWCRRSGPAERVPLTRSLPANVVRRPLINDTPMPWRRDRNYQGRALHSGGAEHGWGLGSHGASKFSYTLPVEAETFQVRLGLDRAAGRGGCIRGRVRLDGRLLFESPFLVGSKRVVDSGRLKTKGRSLVLEIDPAHEGRPPNADPFDIRDAGNWLEPVVGLNSARLARQLATRRAGMIRAWRGWQVDLADDVRVVNAWDEVAPPPGRFVNAVASPTRPLELRRRAVLGSRDRWLIVVATHLRPKDQSPKVEVLVNGEKQGGAVVAPFAPGHERLRPLVVDLARFRSSQPATIAIRQSASPTAVHWHSIRIVDQLPNRQPLFEDRGALVQLSESGEEVKPAKVAERSEKNAYTGKSAARLMGNTTYRLSLPGRLAFREQPGWSEYRFLRFALKKKGGRVAVGLVHEDPKRPVVRYLAGKGAIQGREKSVWSQSLPDAWIVVTVDVFADAGEQQLEAITFRSLDGGSLHVDHVYAASSLEALGGILSAPEPAVTNRLARLKLVEPILAKAAAASAMLKFPDGRTAAGVVINGKGEVLTAGHVAIKAGKPLDVVVAGKSHPAVMKGVSRSGDLGLVQIRDPQALGALPVKDSVDLPARQLYLGVVLIPAKPDRPARLERQVAQVRRSTEKEIWTDLETSRWRSGGPLIDRDGNVVGVLSRRSRFGGFLFARTTSFRPDLTRMRAGQTWGRWPAEVGPTIGVNLATEQTSNGPRCVVTHVLADSPAAKAGLRKGDVVAQLAGRQVKRREDALQTLAQFDPGKKVDLHYLRKQQRLEIQIALIARP